MSTKAPKQKLIRFPRYAHVAIAAARFNGELVDELLRGCMAQLKRLGLSKDRVDVYRVPGAFELPLAAQAIARTKHYTAIVCLGAVVRGETPHFDYVAGECARGLAEVSRNEHLPVIFGVLTTNTEEQAWARAGGKHGHAGRRSADAAAEMVELMELLDPSIPF
jgi:6,7-dimethyl-8-ribityllumazine synthase